MRTTLRSAVLPLALMFSLPGVRAAPAGSTRAVLPPPFPKPNPAGAFAELKRYDSDGRPWRSAREDWDGARKRAESDPQWARWLADEHATVDSWIRRRRDRVEWVAGWSHDFVSPKDGSRLIWTDDIPGEEVPFLHSPSDPQVVPTPKIVASWIVAFRERHAEMMVRAARLYRLTGETRYADWAAGQLDFYTDHYLEWKPQRDGARLYWQTLTEARNLMHYADVVRLVGDRVAPERRERWRSRFFYPEVAVLDHNFHEIHNIATWQRCAAAEVALVFGDENMWQREIDGRWGLRQQIADGITSDYLWWEQSMGYNGFVVQAVLSLFTAAGVEERAPQLAWEMSTAENLMLSPLYLRFPDGHLPNPADSVGIPRVPDRELFASAYRVFPTAIGLAAAANRRDWDTLLDPPAPAGEIVLPRVTSRNLASSQMGILVGSGWQVFMEYGQLARQHAQSEALSFTAYCRGTDITHDAGTVGYGSPLHRGYYTQGPAQNELLVDGLGEVPPQRGADLIYDAAREVMGASQPHYRPDARARRTLQVKDGRLIDTATIELEEGAAPRHLGLTLHLQGKVELPPAFQADPAFAQGRPTPFSYWRHVATARYRDRAEFPVVCSGQKLTVVISVAGPFQVWHGDTPDSPPRRRETFYCETLGSRATFVTTFIPE